MGLGLSLSLSGDEGGPGIAGGTGGFTSCAKRRGRSSTEPKSRTSGSFFLSNVRITIVHHAAGGNNFNAFDFGVDEIAGSADRMILSQVVDAFAPA